METQSVACLPFAVVEVYRDPAPVLDVWEELEAVAPISIYQTRAFLLSWLETLGTAQKITPLFHAKRVADRNVES